MKVIKEDKGYFSNIIYEVYLDNELISSVNIVRISKKHQNYRYMFLLDSNGKVVEDVFQYMNNYCRNESSNSREQAISALKVLYSFLEIKRKSIEELDKVDIKNLSDFILGLNVEGMTESYNLKTSRSITTHNLYFTAIRKYIKAIGIQNESLFEKMTVSIENGGFGMLGHTRTFRVDKYKTNKNRHAIFDNYVPKYISLSEYKEIMTLIDTSDCDYKLRNKVIINLMYTRGLRLGEVLGITLEDIKTHPDDPNAGILLVRNRASDSKYQYAKGCIKVNSKNIYKTKVYNEKGVGYQEVIIPSQLMQQIREYIDVSRDALSLTEKKLISIYNNAIADSIENEDTINYYLFLNKNGKILSSSGWNKNIKKIFRLTGIIIDKNYKKDNLSHKFRHGFAMYLIENEKREMTYVQREMRHKSLQSTMIYYNPKPETILKDTQMIQDNIRKKLTEGVSGDGKKHI